MYTALLIVLVLLVLAALRIVQLRSKALAAGKAAEDACPPLGRFLEVQSPTGPCRMHFLEKAPAEEPDGRPPILMIHGLSGTLRHFSATILDDLARDHRVIAVDRPGMGYSDQPPGGPFGVAQQAETIDNLLKAVDSPPPLVIGHSFGGAVALALALRRPVAGLLLLAPATHRFKNKPPTPDQTVDSAFLRRAIAYTIGHMVITRNREQTLAVAFSPQQPPPEFILAAGGILMLRPQQIETTLADGALLRPALEDQSARYAAIQAPITILFGDQDGLLNAEEHGPPLKAKAPQTELRVLPGVGHMIPFVEPDLTIATAREMTGAAVETS